MIELISIGVIGILVGVFTGLIPGIHPNTIIFASIPFYMGKGLDFLIYASFISGLSISHTFHDFLPAIYIQAPEANTALSTMPGAEKAAKGKGPEAFHSTLLGGIVSVSIFILLLPILYFHLDALYNLIQPLMAYIVAFFLIFLVFKEESIAAINTTFLAGLIGLIALKSSFGGVFILMPLFSGLFAVPAVTASLQKNFCLPEQDLTGEFKGYKGSFTGLASGLVAGIVPGVGAAASTSFLSPLMDKEFDFLAGMGGVNTTDILTSLIALLAVGNARSGAAVALQSLVRPEPESIFLLVGLCIFGSGISALLALRTERVFLYLAEKFDFRIIGFTVLLIIFALSFILTGLFGILSLLTASLIGYYSLVNGCRSCCMAVLLVPALLFFL